MRWLIDFLWSDDGVTAVEYAVMLALICLVILSAVSQVGNVTRNMWLMISGRLESSW